MPLKKIFQGLLPDEHNLDIKETPPVNIERTAINPRGCLGSFYDGYRDNIKGTLKANIKFQPFTLTKQGQYLLADRRNHATRNLLKFVGIDHQLRLSIELKIVSPTGIGSLISYPQLIDEHTRFLCIYQESCLESCRDQLLKLKKSVSRSTCETFATHIITEIIYGIHVLIILQLPPEQEKDIDALLSKIHQSLINNEHAIKMYEKDRVLLDRITSTAVYSNISDLTRIKKLEDIYQKIIELQQNDKTHQPLKYILTPIAWFYGQYGAAIPTLISCHADEIEISEHYLLQQSSEFKVLMLRINHDLPESLQGKNNKQLRNVQNELSELRVLQDNDIERIRNLIWKMRNGDESYSTINKKVSLDPPKDIKRLIDDITIHIEELEAKVKLFKLLQSDGFDYCNAAELGIEERSNEEQITDMLVGNDSLKIILFSNDKFRKDDPESWTKLYSKMLEEQRKNPRLNLVYADFSDSTYKLEKMAIISPSSNITANNVARKTSLQPARPPPLSSENECINILLLGESGVGKSTFINAFANYLRFQSLDEAEHGKPVVIIPVSYTMSINNNFDERIIKFGETDPNENHNDFGQSITQQCKSYVFNISNKKKLRIIDTPGFGDTRGSGQDDLNMEQIFSFLHNFTYLNGVCLLFKPEVTQLNPYFRSCCTQLFDYFGENIRDRFIFCFTNARSTFFAPGSTRPLLNTFFESFPVKKIPFEKKNIFCFDSESFRYLVAVQDSIVFDQNQKDEFKQSWSRSVAESNRFRDFLCDQDPYRRNDEWQSVKDAQIQINYMIRPMLEAMRNLLRNLLLHNFHSSITVCPRNVEPSSMICYTCNRKNIQKIGQFQILPDYLHYSPNMCPSNEQKSTEYRLEYEAACRSIDTSMDDLKKCHDCVCEACVRMGYFLMKNSQNQQVDPFLTGIIRMINEEKFICQKQTSTDLNNKLSDELVQLKAKYEQQFNIIESNGKSTILSNIYDLIKLANESPMVKIQLDAIREYQQCLVKNNERVVDVSKTY